MAEQVRFDVVGRDAGASKTFKDVGDAAAKTGDEVAKLGTKATVAGEQVEGLGDKTRRSGKEADEAGDEYRGLAADIAVAEAAMRSLAAEIDRTGNKDLIKDLNRQRSELRKLNNVQKLLPDLEQQGEEAASGFAAAFVARVGPLIARAPLGPVGAVAAATLAAFLVPTLSAAVAGAVVGGVGVGGVAGGIALAARDARVKAASADLADTVMGDLDEVGAQFVQPTIAGIGEIRAAWNDISDDIDGALGAAAEYVQPLARGVGDLMRELAPGIRDAAEAAGPIVREISEGLPRLGDALSDMLSTFADDADEGASALRYVFMVGESGIRTVTTLVDTFADLYRGVLDVADAGYTAADALWGWNPLFSDRIDDGRAKVDELKGALGSTAVIGKIAGDEAMTGLEGRRGRRICYRRGEVVPGAVAGTARPEPRRHRHGDRIRTLLGRHGGGGEAGQRRR
ncbi:hypothetical protein OOK41_00035 [Micromonospora sp. NBC_01655]|uniref:hypothetical protein n=1 Tax=Micromonospora sp. NBC_01655 TaxID=2975983 RepID=UPI002251FE3D|nr:hypothetical protein [Micromonospora sp. NBC_01655]MCX4468719.1 hypothetical protein [Micromonospora sp. NBC_01655]